MQNVREIMTVVFKAIPVYQNMMKDGKINILDLPLLMELLPYLGPAADNAAQAMIEWKTATASQRDAEIVWARQNFNIMDKKLEDKIEAAIAIIYHAGIFFN